MMDNPAWEKAISFVLRIEGPYEHNPDDPGGETCWGISKKAYPNLDIKAVTIESAREIYYRDFWQACKCDDLPSALAIVTFDAAVNQGVNRARRMLQIALEVPVDGVIGPITLAAAAKSGRLQIKRFLARRIESYAKTIADNPRLVTFAYNWAHRVLTLQELLT